MATPWYSAKAERLADFRHYLVINALFRRDFIEKTTTDAFYTGVTLIMVPAAEIPLLPLRMTTTRQDKFRTRPGSIRI